MGGKRKNKPKDDAPAAEPRHPLTPVIRAEFKRGYKLQAKRGKDMAKLEALVAVLVERRPLEPKHRDHALTGE